jgi:hypothetical protein
MEKTILTFQEQILSRLAIYTAIVDKKQEKKSIFQKIKKWLQN